MSDSNLGLVFDAARFAAEKHQGQTRKVTNDPYIRHPGRVASRTMLLVNTSHQAVAAAWLHDVVEDTGTPIEEIQSRFGPEVAGYVVGLTHVYTKEAYPNLNRQARKQREQARLAEMPQIVQQIKLLDRLDNLGEIDVLSEFAHTYLLESQGLLEALQGADLALEEELRVVMRKLAAVRQKVRYQG